MAPLLQEIATGTGLRWYNEPGSFKSIKGSVMGVRDGFLVAVGIPHNNSVIAAIRFRRTADTASVLEEVKKIPEVNTFSGSGSFNIIGQTLVWSFPKPVVASATKITQQLDAILRTLAMRAEPFTMGKCEQEGCTADVSEITLLNGNCNLICGPCIAKVIVRQQAKLREYESSATNYLKGVTYGAGAAAASGLASGLISFWMTNSKGEVSMKLECILPFSVAFAVTYAMKKGIGRIMKPTALFAVPLAALGIFVSNIVYFTLTLAAASHRPITPQVAYLVMRHLWELKWQDFGKLIVAMEAISVAVSPQMLWEMRPKFSVKSKVLGPPAITRSGMPTAAGANA